MNALRYLFMLQDPSSKVAGSRKDFSFFYWVSLIFVARNWSYNRLGIISCFTWHESFHSKIEHIQNEASSFPFRMPNDVPTTAANVSVIEFLIHRVLFHGFQMKWGCCFIHYLFIFYCRKVFFWSETHVTFIPNHTTTSTEHKRTWVHVTSIQLANF